MGTLTWLLVVCSLFAGRSMHAADARILKVLPHAVDEMGRHTLSPSLYERDAYQVYLREHPDLVAAMRFDIQWKADMDPETPLTLQIEIRTSRRDLTDPLRLSKSVVPRRFLFKRRWTALQIPRQQFNELGKILAWRVSLWRGGEVVAEQRSFLW